MDLLNHPELLNRLAASHALGTLRGGARRRFEALARDLPEVRAAALVWQARLSGMAELQQPVAPPPAVWTRIDNLVRADLDRAAMAAAAAGARSPVARSWLASLVLWRGAAAAGALATVAAVVVGLNLREDLGGRATEVARLQSQLQAAPHIEYVAVLADDQAAPSVLVTFDPRNRQLVLKRVGGYSEAGDKSLQLWALPPAGTSGAPHSLGVLDRAPVLRLTASEGDVRQVPALAISLEPRGGVPGERGPTGPVLFKGALLQTVL